MDTQEHNGYSNRETWIVALWLNNDSFPVYERARKCETVKELQELTRELTGSDNAGLASDLLKTALERVNWSEVLQAVKLD